MKDLIDRQAAIDAVAKGLKGVFVEYQDVAEKLLNNVPAAQPEQIARDIATIIENEHDMRVLLKNTERTKKHDLISRREAIKTAKNVAYYVDEHGSAGGWLAMLVNWLEILPSAQPEHTETHSCDCERTETHESCTDCPLYDHDRHNCPRFNKVIPRTIEAAKPMWIPVTERLPEDACQCIVTAKVKHVDNYPDYEVDTADFADGIFTTANSWWGVESIIAWMPLPEPWKGEQDGTT